MKRDLLDADVTPNDPLYEQMWYINPNFEDRNEAVTSLEDIRHMNVTGAWALGYGLEIFCEKTGQNFFSRFSKIQRGPLRKPRMTEQTQKEEKILIRSPKLRKSPK